MLLENGYLLGGVIQFKHMTLNQMRLYLNRIKVKTENEISNREMKQRDDKIRSVRFLE